MRETHSSRKADRDNDRELTFPLGYVVGDSASIQRLHREMQALAKRELPVLIMGETGVGKELVARTFHLSSPRHQGPFVAINCAAVPAELLEAELFGIGDRVATGVAGRLGQFQRAEGGTLFLDEIGEMPYELQAKLLRALQEKEVHSLGSLRAPIDVRVLAATNADISKSMDEGRFRRDLYYRLAGFVLRVPPLRERREDIPRLVDRFLGRLCREITGPVLGMTNRALSELQERSWPGNVRELENVVRRATYLCPPGRAIELEMLPEQDLQEMRCLGTHATRKTAPVGSPSGSSLRHQSSLKLDVLEREAIQEALRRGDGKQVRAAKLLGISRFSLRRRLERFGLLRRQRPLTSGGDGP